MSLVLMGSSMLSKALIQFSVDAKSCKSAALNMPANLENLAVATGLGKVSVHSSLKERQCQGMRTLPYNCTHLKC